MAAQYDPCETQLEISNSPTWMIGLAVVLFVGMLAAFHQVVLNAVDQAASRHKANALVVEAIWRCNATPPPVPLACATSAKAGSGRVSDPGQVSVAHQLALEN